MELMEEIKELKTYKEAKDLPIAELARRIEADDTTVGRWLKGMATPSCYSLHKVRRFLKSVEGWEGPEPLEPFNGEREQTKKDVNYLKQRIKALNGIEDLDILVNELYITAQLGKVACDTHNMGCRKKVDAKEIKGMQEQTTEIAEILKKEGCEAGVIALGKGAGVAVTIFGSRKDMLFTVYTVFKNLKEEDKLTLLSMLLGIKLGGKI